MWILPPDVYKQIQTESVSLAQFTNEIMSARFTEKVPRKIRRAERFPLFGGVPQHAPVCYS